mmetsp:Transcript_113373/g.315616  ORF Transcript_113373/g.315616 Transcript_113373/m.315616 type:complete len:412 (-) Transcript_113373:804-2039(-)
MLPMSQRLPWMSTPSRPSCCLTASRASVKCLVCKALRALMKEGVSTYCPNEAKYLPSPSTGVLRCSSAYARVGFSFTWEIGQVATFAFSPAGVCGPNGGGSGVGGSLHAKTPVVWASSASMQCRAATDRLPSKLARSCSTQPLPSGAEEEQRWSPQASTKGSPSSARSQSSTASRMPVGWSCRTKTRRRPMANSSSSYAAALAGTLRSTATSSRCLKRRCICASVVSLTTRMMLSMPALSSSSQSQQIAGFTESPSQTGKSQGPAHFVAGHMSGHAPAMGTTAFRTGFCAAIVRGKGSMPRLATIFMTSSWALSERQSSCALPSPCEPMPLPPVTCGRSAGHLSKRCSAGAPSSWGQRGTALASQRAWAAAMRAPRRSAAFAASRSRARTSAASWHVARFFSPSNSCNSRS